MSVETARTDYGVLPDDNGEVDEDATAKLQAAFRRERGEIGWLFDRGEDDARRLGRPRFEP